MSSVLVEKLKKLNNNAIEVMVLTAPWLMPLPSAILTGNSFVRHLGFVHRFGDNWGYRIVDFILGIVVAVSIEAIAILSVSLLEKYQAWNRKVTTEKGNVREKYKEFGRMREYYAWLLIAGYLVISSVLLLVLDIFPSVSVGAFLMFPFIGLLGGVLLVLHNAHNERLRTACGSTAQANVEVSQETQNAKIDTISTAQDNAEKTQVRHKCEKCGVEYDKPQSLSAHIRHCKNKNNGEK